jgi:hypothetical protein
MIRQVGRSRTALGVRPFRRLPRTSLRRARRALGRPFRRRIPSHSAMTVPPGVENVFLAAVAAGAGEVGTGVGVAAPGCWPGSADCEAFAAASCCSTCCGVSTPPSVEAVIPSPMTWTAARPVSVAATAAAVQPARARSVREGMRTTMPRPSLRTAPGNPKGRLTRLARPSARIACLLWYACCSSKTTRRYGRR